MEYTQNLNLFKYDTEIDGKQVFSINEALNNNWDKLDSLVVKKSGDVMTGSLQINGNHLQNVFRCITNLPSNQNPEQNTGVGKFQVLDQQGNYLMQCGCEKYLPNCKIQAFIRAHSPVNWEDYSATIWVGMDNENHVSTSAPACSDNNSILTTVSMLKQTNGYMKLGNGVILQWGAVLQKQVNTYGGYVVTFYTAFSSAPHCVFIDYAGGNNGYILRVKKTTVSNFTISMDYFSTNGGTNKQDARWFAIGV